jgi:hypothetical protein
MANTDLDINKDDFLITACIRCGQGSFAIDRHTLYNEGPIVFTCPFCNKKTRVDWHNGIEIKEE